MKESDRKKQIRDSLLFVSPGALIRREHLTRRDVAAIKNSLSMRLGTASFFFAGLLFFFNIALIISLGIQSDWRHAEVFGIWSLVAVWGGLFGCIIVVALHAFAKLTLNKKTAIIVTRIAIDLFLAIVGVSMCLMVYTDAMMGYTKDVQALSAGVLLVVLICLAQPAYWVDAMAIDIWITLVFASITLGCRYRFGMGGIGYYMLICLALPFICYLVVSILFFAETNHYVQAKRSEMLYNSATYDELTKCKNRAALTHFLEENVKIWERNQTNLLLIMFDIDNFKQYNDQFSHLAGDNCLRLICDAIRKAFPNPDLDFYRYGGEEFLLFFELRNPEDAGLILEQARLAVRNIGLASPEGSPDKTVTISLGASMIAVEAPFLFEEALKRVDSYLYIAKGSGKDVACLDGKLVGENGRTRGPRKPPVKPNPTA